ncbi:hypothetical protein [Mycetocola sp. JXN-3]|uniref:phage holin n=1 Tax=Mycetocola sp. JXN-3 TaxID=2116510 RepID=UPI00165D045E|nr:hypothetical protein [Mycetocola sp. JXN-3]
MNNIIRNPKARAYIYGILVAAGGVALIYGVATETQIAGWLGLAGSILGNGLALANTPTAGKHAAD